MIKAVRVTIRYGADFAEVIRCVPIRGPAPTPRLDIDDDADGAWVEVVEGEGRPFHRQILRDPSGGQEVFQGDDGYCRDDPGRADLIASLELPWPGSGTRLIVHARPGGIRDQGSELPPSMVADIVLVPALPPPMLGAAAPPPPRRRPIWGAGNPNALTLAFYAEGFTAAEMPAFHAVVDRCVSAFETTAPFAGLLDHMAVAEVETVSAVNGISGVRPTNTYFRGHFQKGSLDRVILVDQAIAAEALDSGFRGSAVALIVANTSKYGGSGGAATVFSCEPNWAAEIAMHELGHSLFGLADEYEAAGQAATMNPVEPNVCATSERNKIKWRDLIAPDTPLPTCAAGEPAPLFNPVGAYEGAKYQQRGVFRPTFDCKMRTPGSSFCPVCTQEIERRLSVHRPPIA